MKPFGWIRSATVRSSQGGRRRSCGISAARVLALLAGLILLSASASAAGLAQAPDLDRLDAFMARAQEDWPVPGFAVAIVKDGETVLAKGYGVRRSDAPEPVDEHTLFAIASNTKAFTAAALAMLAEEGRLGWDDRVQEHLPWFQLYDSYVSHEMRIRDLLSHRSGLGTFSGDLLWYGTDYSAGEVVRRARYVPQAGPFRASYGYSNLMFITAGEVVSAVSGMSWQAFVQERILNPLGMNRTATSVAELRNRENVATPHKNRIDEIIPLEWYNWDAMAAAGGIISSVSDMARWLELCLSHGTLDDLELFSEGSSWEMWTIHNPFSISPQARRSQPTTHFRGYGLGWSLNDYQGRLVASHGGGYDGMFSRVVLVPEEGLGIVVLTNSMTSVSTAVANTVLDAYLGAPDRNWSKTMLDSWKSSRERFEARQTRFLEEQVQGTLPSLPLEGYAGTYGGEMYGDATVSLEDGGLVLRLLPNPDLMADLTHLHHDTFLLEWRKTFAWFGTGAATFRLDPFGNVTEIDLNVPNDDLWFYELELKRKPEPGNAMTDTPFSYLALGDSYTIGESVDSARRWPVQLVRRLREEGVDVADPVIIARTGWTTDELAAGIGEAEPGGPFDLVSLLIGVNNQYRGRDPEEYRDQLRELLEGAVHLAGGRRERVLVLSIPDWGVMPFAQDRDREQIAREIDTFNRIKAEEAEALGIRHVDVTGISRKAAGDPSLGAEDGLHPSGAQYARWVERALPVVRELLEGV